MRGKNLQMLGHPAREELKRVMGQKKPSQLFLSSFLMFECSFGKLSTQACDDPLNIFPRPIFLQYN